MRTTLILLLLAFAIQSCSKDNKKNNPGLVMVRLINQSSVVLENARVADAEFGNVISGAFTGYQKVETPIYSGFCNFSVQGKEEGAGLGICGTPMPPPLEAGYYTFRIGNSVANGYFTFSMTKDE